MASHLIRVVLAMALAARILGGEVVGSKSEAAEPFQGAQPVDSSALPSPESGLPRRTEGQADVELFSRSDCPQCARARAYLDELQTERPTLAVRIVDVADEPEALARLHSLAGR